MMASTNIRFEEGLNYSFVRSDNPEIVKDIYGLSKADQGVVIDDIDLYGGRIQARIPLQMLEEGRIFRGYQEIRKMAYAGGNASAHISH